MLLCLLIKQHKPVITILLLFQYKFQFHTNQVNLSNHFSRYKSLVVAQFNHSQISRQFKINLNHFIFIKILHLYYHKLYKHHKNNRNYLHQI